MTNVQAYLTKGRTGQIIVKFKGQTHLCKLYVEDGEVVYLSCGRKTPEEIINDIGSMEIEAVNFIDGIHPPKRFDSPVTEKILAKLGSVSVTPATGSEAGTAQTVEASKVDTLIEDFIDIVGPLGTIIVDDALKKLGYTKGQDMEGTSYNKLVQILSEEVPEGQRAQFRARHT